MRRELLLLHEMRDAALAIRDLVGVRNRIVHGYWDIDVETLVATATMTFLRW